MQEKRKSSEKRGQGAVTFPREGAVFHTYHMGRTVRIYPITEGELKTISIMNTLAIVFFSIGSALLSFALGIIVNCAIDGQLTEVANTLLRVVAPICGVLGIISYVIGILALVTRKSELGRISKESSSD